MTPIEQLAEIAGACGLAGNERREGSTGKVRVFEFDRPMPAAVRRAGLALGGIRSLYWQAGHDGPLKEGFTDEEGWEKVYFPAKLFSLRRLEFRYRQLKGCIAVRRSRLHEAQFMRRLERPASPPIQVDRSRIGLKSDEYARISAASNVVSRRITGLVEPRSLRNCWCYGDSSYWSLVLSLPTETDFDAFMRSDQLDCLAADLLSAISESVIPSEGFTLTIDIDTDERVKAAEGWFLRLRGAGQPGCSFAWQLENDRLLRSPGRNA